MTANEPRKQSMDSEQSEVSRSSKDVDACWDVNLKLLEDQINTSSPRIHYLSAHGSLFSAIVWLQSQMVRLLVAKRCQSKIPSIPLSDIWYDGNPKKQLLPDVEEWYQKDFSQVVSKFQNTFCLSKDETQALWCLQCLRNMLAHGNLSISYRGAAGHGPSLAYFPRGTPHPCFNCQHHLKQEAAKRIRVDFDPGSTKTYFKYVRTVGTTMKRIASGLSLEPVDLW